jgi:hypothetical protein
VLDEPKTVRPRVIHQLFVDERLRVCGEPPISDPLSRYNSHAAKVYAHKRAGRPPLATHIPTQDAIRIAKQIATQNAKRATVATWRFDCHNYPVP